MFDSSGVSAGDEVGDSAVGSGGSVPQHFSWAGVVHGRWPDGEDDVVWVEGSVVQQGLVLLHSGIKRYIIIFAPSAEWVEQEDWVLVSLLQQLLPGVLQQEHVPVVQWVSHLESVHSISILGLDLVVDLLWGESVLVEAVLEVDLGHAAQALTRDQEVALGHDPLHFEVLHTLGSEDSSTDFFLSVVKESGFFNDSEHLIADLSAPKSDSLGVLQLLFLLSGHALGDGH